MTSVVAPATPKIVGKALYLELVANPALSEEEQRKVLGWQSKGTRQLILFPEYQDDTGRTYGAVVMERIVSEHSPRSQWDMSFIDSYRVKEADLTKSDSYVDYPNYSRDEWNSLSEREKFDSRKRAISILLKNLTVNVFHEKAESGEYTYGAKQGWTVRDDKPISVEVTDQDMNDLHLHRKTPQAVIRRINKVRDTLDKFPKSLA